MPDEIRVYRLRIGLNYRRQMKVKGLDYLSNFELLIILSLLLLCNDIEKNPGPSSESPSEISFTSCDTSTLPSDINTKNKFSVVHYNVQNRDS